MKKILMVLTLGILLLALASATEIPIYNINENVNISVTCINGDYAVCDNTSICNINIFNPDGTILITGENMINDGSYHYLNITPLKIGLYHVTGYCHENGFNAPIDFNFETENRDKEFKLNLENISDRLVLIILLVISTILLIFSETRMYGGIGYAIAGLILMFSGINFIVSILILVLGLFMSVLNNQ